MKESLRKISNPEAKAKIIAKVVQKILVFEDGIEIFFHVGRSQYIDSSNLGGLKKTKPLVSSTAPVFGVDPFFEVPLETN